MVNSKRCIYIAPLSKALYRYCASHSPIHTHSYANCGGNRGRHDWSSTSQNFHVSPLLRSLHWLPDTARTEYETLMLAFKTLKGMVPPYLQSVIKHYNPCRVLRSANTGRLTEPSLKTAGQRPTRPRHFALLAPKQWNKLPVALRTTDSLPKFCHDLKTHLFTFHFSP